MSRSDTRARILNTGPNVKARCKPRSSLSPNISTMRDDTSAMKEDSPREGIEILFDTNRGYLRLACEPDAFRPYLELARRDVEAFPEIDTSKVIELCIIDTATFVARRDAPRKRFLDAIFSVLICVAVGLAAFGFISLIRLFR